VLVVLLVPMQAEPHAEQVGRPEGGPGEEADTPAVFAGREAVEAVEDMVVIVAGVAVLSLAYLAHTGYNKSLRLDSRPHNMDNA
jgi:hypothetical protein